MFKFWKSDRARKQPPEPLRRPVAGRDVSPEAIAERRRLADTDGKLRRIRQLAENHRLL
jgi:hypothetical protein